VTRKVIPASKTIIERKDCSMLFHAIVLSVA
jgi:hypothetical protein